MSNISDKKRESWGSRMGYILSTLGMAIGLGAMWRFPMVAAQNGGGAFVLAFALITIVIAIPAGWAELGLGRWTKSGSMKSFSRIIGKSGNKVGFIFSLIPLGLDMYYLIIIGYVLYYIFQTITGGAFLAEPGAFFDAFVANKMATLFWAMIALIVTTLTCLGGIKKGIERICKVMLPVLFIILLIISVRIITLPGVAKGIEFYVRPDFSMWKDPNLWITASGMALFAIGLGPAFLLVYGSYLDDKADVAFDFLTIASWNLTTCILAGFATVPAVVLFGLDLQSGAGLVFTVLPEVFKQMPGTLFFALIYFIALLFAALSSSIGIMEATVTVWADGFNWDRKKTVLIVTAITCVGMIICNFVDITVFDYLIANVGYNASAAFIAIMLAWKFGAKNVRDQWLNPTSCFHIGSWFDILYKFVAVPVLLYFTITSVIGFVQLLV